MSLILRVDVDKPFGKHTLIRKLASKFKEDFYPLIRFKYGYLSHLKTFVEFCNSEKISGHFYHRICTSPDTDTLKLYKKGNHILGLHLENSISKETLDEELNLLQKNVSGYILNSFSKHGSGIFKLGKYHYPPYEPDKYLSWAKELNIHFPSGNGIATCGNDLQSKDGWFENLFWSEPNYRHADFNKIEQLIGVAKKWDVVILIHPCNYIADKQTRTDFERLVLLSKQEGVDWKYFG